MAKKFNTVLESALGRYTNNAGFLVGDYVVFKKKYKGDPSYGELGINVKEMIDEIAKGDKHLRVRGVSNEMPSRAPGNTENMNGRVTITIAVDEGGGREYNFVTVPHCLLEPVKLDGVNNIPALPKSMEYSRETDASHGEADEAPEVDANRGMKNAGKRGLAKKNTKLQYASAPATSMYLQNF